MNLTVLVADHWFHWWPVALIVAVALGVFFLNHAINRGD